MCLYRVAFPEEKIAVFYFIAHKLKEGNAYQQHTIRAQHMPKVKPNSRRGIETVAVQYMYIYERDHE